MGRPSILRTKELPEEKPYKGGVTMCREMFRDARRLLADTNARVTTLIDYYGLPADFRWLAESSALPHAKDRVMAYQAALRGDMKHPRFHPFLALHELEPWIFAAPAEEHHSVKGLGDALTRIAANAAGAELVNDGPTTHLSIRLATSGPATWWPRRY